MNKMFCSWGVSESDLSAAAEATRKEGKRNIFRESAQQGINKAKKIYKKFECEKKEKEDQEEKEDPSTIFLCDITKSLSLTLPIGREKKKVN